MLVEKTNTTTSYAVTKDEIEILVTVMYDENCDATTIQMMYDDGEEIEEGTDLFNEVVEAINELE